MDYGKRIARQVAAVPRSGIRDFFELVLGISGFGLGRLGWPILLIGLGVFVLIRAVFRRED